MRRSRSARLVAVTLFFVVGAARARAQEVDFNAPRIAVYESPDPLLASTRGDFDRDGLLDVVACANTRLVFFRGRAFDGFAPPVEFPGVAGADRARDAARGDFDGDGDLDVVFAHALFSGAAGLSVFDGDGAGGFAAPRFIPLPQSAQFVFTAHLDGDGTIDLVLRSSHRDWLMTALGDGAGGFALATVMPVDKADGIAVADLDSDGFEDVVHSRPFSDEVVVLGSDGSGGLAFRQAIGGLPEPTDVLSGDFDLDGAPDVAVLVGGPAVASRVSILSNDSTGFLAESASIADPEYRIDRFLAVADFDGDEIADLLAERAGRARFFVGDGVGGFAPPFAPLHLVTLASVETGDFDGDSRRDLASVGRHFFGSIFLDRAALFRGDGRGGFIRFAATTDDGSPRWRTLGHLDGDGVPDGASVGDGEFLKVRRGAGGTFEDPVVLPVDGLGGQVVIDDLDADGDGDVAVTFDEPDAHLEVFLGDGSIHPGLGGRLTFFDGVRCTAVTSGDVDGDGDRDLIVAHPEFFPPDIGGVSVLLSDGAGGFAPLPPVPCGAGPTRLALGDFDDDGVPDLAVGKQGGSALFLMRGDGAGGFASVAAVAWSSTFRFGLAVADIDGDGRDDVAQSGEVGSALDPAIRVLTRTGAFTFAERRFPLSVTGRDIAAADFDGDGSVDVGTSGGDFLLNDGLGGFTMAAFEVSYSAGTVAAAAFGDVDGDALSDLVVTFDWIVLNRTLDPERARRGNVNAAAGALADVLRFNGSRGRGQERRVEIGPSDPAELTVGLPPSRAGKRAKFALYEWIVDPPGSSAVNRLPLGIGFSLLRAPASPASGASLPARIWNNAGRNAFLGVPGLPSAPAPSTVYSLPGGIGVPATLVYQGIIVDPDAPNGRGGLTNAVEVVVR